MRPPTGASTGTVDPVGWLSALAGPGDLVLLFGPSQTGKSTLASLLCNAAGEAGGCVYLDTEGKPASFLAVEPRRLNTLRELLEAVPSLPPSRLLVVDSIATPLRDELNMLAARGASADQRALVFMKARAVVALLREYAFYKRAVVLVVSQPRSGFMQGPESEQPPVGGSGLYAYKHVLRTELVESRPDRTVCRVLHWSGPGYGRGHVHGFLVVSGGGASLEEAV